MSVCGVCECVNVCMWSIAENLSGGKSETNVIFRKSTIFAMILLQNIFSI